MIIKIVLWDMLLRRPALSQLIYLGSLVLLTAGNERPVTRASSERDFCPLPFGSLATRLRIPQCLRTLRQEVVFAEQS